MIKLLGQFISKKDKTRKWVFENENNEIIEISLISNKNQDILYAPTHYNCPLGCRECTLSLINQCSTLKPIRYEELMEAIGKTILEGDKRVSTNTKILISFRGVGEPLLNMPLLERIYNEKYSLEIFGYNNIGVEISTFMPNEELKNIASNLKYPTRIIYRLSSPCDDKRRNLEPSVTLSVDTSLSYLKIYNDGILNEPERKKQFKAFFGRKNPTEIRYSIIPDVNDSLFELANLQYFQDRFQIPISFLKNDNGEQEWIDNILSHYPEAKLRIEKAYGRDIGSLHGEFDESSYATTNGDDAKVAPVYHLPEIQENVQTIKKVLDNKVV